MVARVDQVGLQPNRLFVAGDGVQHPALVVQRQAQAQVIVGLFRPKLHGPLVGGLRAARVAGSAQGPAQIGVGRRGLRVEVNGLAETGQCLARILLSLVQLPQAVVHSRHFGIDRQGLFAGRDRLGNSADRPIDLGQIGVKHGVETIDPNRLVDELDRLLGPAHLIGEQSDQVTGSGVARMKLQHAAIHHFRLAQRRRDDALYPLARHRQSLSLSFEQQIRRDWAPFNHLGTSRAICGDTPSPGYE